MDLHAVLEQLGDCRHPRVLIGFETADDAGVFMLDESTCLVQSLDFFTPVVDDPYDYGRIAAANALSDLYAMGVKPLCALSIICFPIGKLGREMMADILRGGRDKALEAGVPIMGGHSVDDAEPKYGLVVTGVAEEERIIRNSGAQPGDVLLLTKPIGSGIYTTAIKQGKATPEQEKTVVEVMAELNRKAAEAMVEVGVNACTDVTGYGLIGHLMEMLEASGVAAIVAADEVPKLHGLRELARDGAVPGGSMMNLRYAEDRGSVDWHPSIDELDRVVLCDAQTSGGLIISCPADKLMELKLTFAAKKVAASVFGVVFDGPAGALVIVP